MDKGTQKSRWLALAAAGAGLVMMMILPVQAQEGDRIAQQFLNNVVQLTTTFSTGQEDGFGFVIGERDNRLYVVTARHVVRNDDDPGVTTQQVQARFAADRGKTYPVVVLGVAYRDLDIVLLEIARPFESYTWESRCLAATPARGERVWFIGRNKEWWIPPDAKAGVIEEEPLLGELVVQIDSVMPGTSGAPLFTANGIVGMIVKDSPENVVVISLEIIQQLVRRKWNYPWGLQAFAAPSPTTQTLPPAPTAAPTAKPTAAPTPTPEPTPTNTPPATAVLTLRSNVYEDQVFVDGAYYGATRLDIELPLGQHNIRIEKAGYLPFEQTIDLQAAYMLKAVLEPEPTPTPTAKPTAAPTVQPTAAPTPRSPAHGDVWREPQTGMEFVWIEGGCFKMGSPDSESGRYSDEGPVHEVCLDGFWMGKYEVTNEQYRKWKRDHDNTNYDGHSLNGDDQPAVYVSWEDAKKFAEWLGTDFRLPTEAEWEYAARASTSTSRFWGDNPAEACRYANVHDQTSDQKFDWDWEAHKCNDGYAVTAPVGSFRPNQFGLYDILGNVWEWCQDWYASDYYANSPRQNPQGPSDGSDRVLRGGSWGNVPGYVRSAVRNFYAPSDRLYRVGLRLVRKK